MLSYVVINGNEEFPVGMIVKAVPMNTQQLAVFNGNDIMIENPVDGYVVHYNTSSSTWISDDKFNENFKLLKDMKMEKVENMSMGEAIEALESGKRYVELDGMEQRCSYF